MLCRIFLWCQVQWNETEFGFEEITKSNHHPVEGCFFAELRKNPAKIESGKRKTTKYDFDFGIIS